MKRQVMLIASAAMILFSVQATAQDDVKTIFKGGLKSSGGYGAATNKFTTIRGKYANISGIYGGWYLNHKFMIGLEVAAVTNNIRVPQEFSVDPNRRLSYEYGQGGLRTEYVLNSGKPVHLAFHLFAGAGFTVQYDRFGWEDHDRLHNNKANWFFVTEPGVQVEVNLFKWMRFSPGVSYRAAFGSDAPGIKDKDISNLSYNATLKFGRF